jgi:hypothetical protein
VKIERDSKNGITTLRLIGRLQAVHLPELKKEIKASRADRVCLREVSLVDIDVVRFLAALEGRGLSIVNCSAYIREWMGRERQQKD